MAPSSAACLRGSTPSRPEAHSHSKAACGAPTPVSSSIRSDQQLESVDSKLDGVKPDEVAGKVIVLTLPSAPIQEVRGAAALPSDEAPAPDEQTQEEDSPQDKPET